MDVHVVGGAVGGHAYDVYSCRDHGVIGRREEENACKICQRGVDLVPPQHCCSYVEPNWKNYISVTGYRESRSDVYRYLDVDLHGVHR